MSAPREDQAHQPGDTDAEAALGRTVVAVVLEWRGRVGLFRRSRTVDHDQGLWHCITGYVEPGHHPEQQALQELFEETGLLACDVACLSRGPTLHLADGEGHRWAIHTFRAWTDRRRLRLNQEHDTYRWVRPKAVPRFRNCVAWLDDVLRAVEPVPRPCRIGTSAHAGLITENTDPPWRANLMADGPDNDQ